MSDWDTTRALLAGIPDLRGAPCKRREDLYERTISEHHAAGRLTKTELDDARREALQLCNNRCPALEQCREWLDALPLSRRPAGVVAGIVITANGVPSKIATPTTLGVSAAES